MAHESSLSQPAGNAVSPCAFGDLLERAPIDGFVVVRLPTRPRSTGQGWIQYEEDTPIPASRARECHVSADCLIQDKSAGSSCDKNGHALWSPPEGFSEWTVLGRLPEEREAPGQTTGCASHAVRGVCRTIGGELAAVASEYDPAVNRE